MAQVRRALIDRHYLAEPDPALKPDEAEIYDPTLVAAVRQFQQDTGFVDDGVLGNSTRRALRGMDANRLLMIEQSLKQPDPPAKGKYILVNLAAGLVYAMQDDVPVIVSRAVVGKVQNPTPAFSTRIQAVWVNPSWHVPKSIVEKEFGGKAHVEKPGPKNPLGKILLEMPNKDEIFLHFTNQPTLFERDLRNFSHGCVRVQRIEDVARWILGEERWKAEDVEASLGTYTTKKFALEQSIPIYLQYRTATVGSTGAVIYHPDPYRIANPPPPPPPPVLQPEMVLKAPIEAPETQSQ